MWWNHGLNPRCNRLSFRNMCLDVGCSEGSWGRDGPSCALVCASVFVLWKEKKPHVQSAVVWLILFLWIRLVFYEHHKTAKKTQVHGREHGSHVFQISNLLAGPAVQIYITWHRMSMKMSMMKLPIHAGTISKTRCAQRTSSKDVHPKWAPYGGMTMARPRCATKGWSSWLPCVGLKLPPEVLGSLKRNEPFWGSKWFSFT